MKAEEEKRELSVPVALSRSNSSFLLSSVFICVHLWFRSLFVFSVPLRLNRFTEFGGKNMATGRASNPGGLSAGQRRGRWAEGEMLGRRLGRARRRRCVRRREEPGSFANDAAAC